MVGWPPGQRYLPTLIINAALLERGLRRRLLTNISVIYHQKKLQMPQEIITIYNINLNYRRIIMPNTNPATEKQMALIKKHNMPVHSDTLTVSEASAIIDTFAKLNNWGQKPFTPKTKAEPTPMPDSF